MSVVAGVLLHHLVGINCASKNLQVDMDTDGFETGK